MQRMKAKISIIQEPGRHALKGDMATARIREIAYICRMTDQKQNRTELSELGEFGLIKKLTEGFITSNSETLYGIGDDAAVLDAGTNKILVSTDLLVEGIHFDLTYTPLKHLGYKSVVVNLSDIVAMNGRPAQVTVSLAVSNRFSLEALEEIYSGIKLACEKYRVDLVGGDTASSLSGLVISVTVIGYAEEKNIVYRSGAKEHDLICVSGDLGSAFAGLLLLEREKAVFKANPDIQPDLDGFDYALQRQLKPEARVDVLEQLRKNALLPTSMIDISDGLASDLMHICEESGTGAVIYADKIPVDPTTISLAEEFKTDPLTYALNGGEDYELLFTVKPTEYEAVSAIAGISVIGHITESAQGVRMVTPHDTIIPLNAQGWDAFRKEGD
jgi:thiamine-monophosphate kinase